MFDRHTIETLEFPKVVEIIRGKCITPYGPSQVAAFQPMFDRESIEKKLSEVTQMMDLHRFGTAFPLYRMEDVRDLLDRSTVEGGYLDPKELLRISELVEVSISINGYAKDERDNFPALAEYLPKVRAFPELRQEIRKAIDETGEVKDSASSALKKIRHDLSDGKRKIIARLESVIAAQKKQSGWQDDVVTQRNGRYVIPVIAGSYSQNMGILHDRSQSGATFWIEPKETVELNNRLNQLMQEERVELDRILRAITAEVAQRSEALHENCRVIGILDALHAAAEFSVKIKAMPPTISDAAELSLVDARHPLLILHLGKAEDVVPLTLNLDDARQAILITGPNTGGKTIALKTLGLLVLMAQSGLPLPASDKSKVGIFRELFADIGDEQSIELSLSTFSSHVLNIIRAIKQVSPRSLVLFDEIGAGTDPKEGAALAESIILHLVETGTKLVATTHFSHLKTLALQHPEIENASMEFDRKSLSPTFRIQLGIPGSSYAVEIARRLGMPETICDHSSELLGSGERSLTELIASLESELAVIRKDRTELTQRLAAASELEDHYKTQTEKLQREIDERKKEALHETETLLDEARRETERLVAEIRSSQAGEKEVKAAHRSLKEKQQKAKKIGSGMKQPGQPAGPGSFNKGDRVRMINLNREGEIDEILSGSRARVRVGNISTVVEIRHLEKLDSKPGQKMSASRSSYDSGGSASPEIHLRGMTVDEATEALERFIDDAVVNSMSQVYVIHGKGTGTLRRTLAGWLKKHPEVAEIRLGNWNEGGAGVTVVKLKS